MVAVVVVVVVVVVGVGVVVEVVVVPVEVFLGAWLHPQLVVLDLEIDVFIVRDNNCCIRIIHLSGPEA